MTPEENTGNVTQEPGSSAAPQSNAPDTAPHDQPKQGGPLSGPLGIIISVVLLVAAGVLVWRTLYNPSPIDPDPPARTYLCSETQKSFTHKPTMGEKAPIMSPHSNKKTGYPAESCFCIIDGKKSEQATLVILNEYLGKKEQTLCPKCKAPVFPHNADRQAAGDRAGPPSSPTGTTPSTPAPTTQPAGG